MRSAILTLIMAVVFVGVMAGVVAGIIQTQRQQPESAIVPPEPAPPIETKQEPKKARQPRPEPPTPIAIGRVPLGGQDLADLQGLMMWKWQFRLPRAQYTAHIWVEHWTRDADQPRIEQLATATGEWEDADLVLKVPTEQDPSMLIRVGPTQTIRAASTDPLDVPIGARMDVLTGSGIQPDLDIHLVTFTYQDFGSEPNPAGLLTEVHRDHDVTIYVKARFTRGAYVPFGNSTQE